MYISRLVIRNFRNFRCLDLPIQPGLTCIIGENNTGKTNLLHAVRLVLDANLSSRYRQLADTALHSGLTFSTPEQVIVSVELRDYEADEQIGEFALVAAAEIEDGVAALHYRFRPKASVQEQIAAGERGDGDLTIEDYHYEITGGGEKDPADVEWDEPLGSSVRFGDLQSFHVEYLPALRDVRTSLRQSQVSPLGRMLNLADVPTDEKDDIVAILQTANDEISDTPTISAAGAAIENAFTSAAGEAHATNLRLGMAEPSFASIARNLTVLLSNDALTDFDPALNGLGLNNVLYVSMLMEFFRRRVASASSAGQLLLVEEPEAHLHPQLQRVLYSSVRQEAFQAFLTTHSTHISSHAPLSSYITLTHSGTPATSSCVPATHSSLNEGEVADLERFLDATRSTLLYARRVILVEGPAELFLFPALVQHVMDIDLDRHGITVVPIHGVHFSAYAKLFGPDALEKKCAIVSDADGHLEPSDADIPEDMAVVHPPLRDLENEFLRVFQCPVMFERALALPGLLHPLSRTAADCGFSRTARFLQSAADTLSDPDADPDEAEALLEQCRARVLSSAKRMGKARFAQIAARHMHVATEIPAYLEQAVDWLIES